VGRSIIAKGGRPSEARETVKQLLGHGAGSDVLSRYWNEDLFAAVSELRRIADDAGMTLIELAYRWLLSRPPVDCMLLGASSLQQLDANLAALDGPAPDDDTVRRCDDVWATLRGAAPDYNR
jgi:aryl-alcohol dehydrogenase-like predicted oxidoreductase